MYLSRIWGSEAFERVVITGLGGRTIHHIIRRSPDGSKPAHACLKQKLRDPVFSSSLTIMGSGRRVHAWRQDRDLLDLDAAATRQRRPGPSESHRRLQVVSGDERVR